MKKKSTSQSAFLNLRVLFGLFVMLAGVFLALVSFGTFSRVFAQNGTTREQMTLTLAQALNLPQPPACVPGAEMFNDVPASSPFCPFIEELSRRGITGGCATGLFCPRDPVTRQQMAVFVVNTANQEGVPVAGATIDADGTVLSFFNHRGGAPTVSHVAASGIYTVTFPGLEGQVAFDGATATVSLDNSSTPGMISRSSSGGNALVYTFNSAGALADRRFELVVVRPGELLTGLRAGSQSAGVDDAVSPHY